VCTSKKQGAARAAGDAGARARFRARHGEARQRWMVLAAIVGSAISFAAGCVTVRPEQRAILADPVMQFQSDPREAAQRQHVLENREGSFGGTSVQGGGCGCN
jgi:hypothetical protein